MVVAGNTDVGNSTITEVALLAATLARIHICVSNVMSIATKVKAVYLGYDEGRQRVRLGQFSWALDQSKPSVHANGEGKGTPRYIHLSRQLMGQY